MYYYQVTSGPPSRLIPAVKDRPADVDASDPNKKIDWHDYTAIAQEQQRTGQFGGSFQGTVCVCDVGLQVGLP